MTVRQATDRSNVISRRQQTVHDETEVTRRADVADGRCQYLHVVDGDLVDVVSRAKPQHVCLAGIYAHAAGSHSSTLCTHREN